MRQKTFGARLKEARTSAGLSQAALAKSVDVTDGYICQLERGTRPSPRVDLCISIAKKLGVRAEWLMTGKGKTA